MNRRKDEVNGREEQPRNVPTSAAHEQPERRRAYGRTDDQEQVNKVLV